MGTIIELLIDYEVLVAAVREALSSKSIDFDKESDIGYTVFKLRHWQLGDNMGEVKVRKVGDHRSELSYGEPLYLLSDRLTPDADLVEQNKKLSREILDAINAGESAIAIDLLQQGAEVTGKIYEQEEELYRRKQRYFEQAIQAMFNWLYHDTILRRALQTEGNEEAIRQLAWLAGEELSATTDEPQAGSGAVAEQLTPAEDEEGKVEIFYAYAREDEDLRDELEKHLRMLEREGVITNWHDRRIDPGKEWKGEIDTHLNTARVILLLISSDFVDSDYCWDVEVKRAIERHEAGEARVIPVILRPVDWESAPFGKLQALPTDAKPVTSWANQDEAFLDVARGIRAQVMELRAEDNDSVPNHENRNP
jgi:hypothetical protein